MNVLFEFLVEFLKQYWFALLNNAAESTGDLLVGLIPAHNFG